MSDAGTTAQGNEDVSAGVFVTGTDTGVGKTHVGVMLARLLVESGARVRARKPVESGCPVRDGALVPQDAEALRAACGAIEPLASVCSYRLLAALSPERAAALENVQLQRADLLRACRSDVAHGDFLLVEGAGGFCSPIAADALNADLAVALGLPVLLVTADRLGAIHQVLVTAEAIARRGLVLAGVVLNQVAPPCDAQMDNATDLARWLDAEVVVVPHCAAAGDPAPEALRALAGRLAAHRPAPAAATRAGTPAEAER